MAKKKARKTPAGPLTFEQADAIAISRLPKPKAPKKAIASASPARIAAERRKLVLKQRQETARRIDEYAATMKMLKARGVKGIRSAADTRFEGLGRDSTSGPIQVFAEGDSWFKYPVPTFGGGVIDRLQKLIGLPILNLAVAGDEVRFMLGVEQRQRLFEVFRDGSPAGGTWDAALFSGGGNDIVDNPMAMWIREFATGVSAQQLIHQSRFDAALALVRAGYEDLIALRDTLSPGTHLIFHGYDYAIPDGRGICGIGPWLQPTFKLRKFTVDQTAFEVVKEMLTQFSAMQQSLQTSHAKVSVIKTQGVLAPVPASWHNELHPQKQGFNTFAGMFHAELKRLFPGRVL